jgi:Acetyltransferases
MENIIVEYGKCIDINSWMQLVHEVHTEFPGLETSESIEEHKRTVLKFMDEQRAVCVKDMDKVVGVLLFSKKHNMICCLAVLPEYRRQGIANLLLQTALRQLDNNQIISVSTFREGDSKGIAPRKLYKKLGFVEDELIHEFGYPNQKFLRYPITPGHSQ